MEDVLNQVIQLQQQGMPVEQINKQLRDQGASPKEINEAIQHAQVKTAVSQEQQAPPEQQMQAPQAPSTQEMEQSMMQQPQEAPAEGQQEQYYPEAPQAYPQEAYYPQAELSTDTITEIAEQVVAEKISDFKKQIGDISTFKNHALDELQDLDERLKRIEKTIDKLQQSVIGKIGEFGESTQAIHKDLENLHNTTSKLMNPLIDNYKELKKIIKGQ